MCKPHKLSPSLKRGQSVYDNGGLHYDTCSFFNTNLDVDSLRKRYASEVEVLKERLQEFQKNG